MFVQWFRRQWGSQNSFLSTNWPDRLLNLFHLRWWPIALMGIPHGIISDDFYEGSMVHLVGLQLSLWNLGTDFFAPQAQYRWNSMSSTTEQGGEILTNSENYSRCSPVLIPSRLNIISTPSRPPPDWIQCFSSDSGTAFVLGCISPWILCS